jgi:tetratricopeptide (TPR) repeat protein
VIPGDCELRISNCGLRGFAPTRTFAAIGAISFFMLMAASFVFAGDTPDSKLTEAREAYLTGEYEKAAEVYAEFLTPEAVSKSSKDAVPAACGWAEIDTQTGKYAESISRLKSIEKSGAGSPLWHTSLASMLALTGDYDAALQHNREALRLDKKCFRARWQLGQLQEMLGDFAGALETYRPINDVMTGKSLPENAEDLTYLGQGFLRYSALVRHAELVRRTRHVLTEVFQEAFEFVDGLYWPARLAGAELLLEKHNLKEAGGDFEAILEQNKQIPAAYVGLGRMALEDWNFEEAEKRVKSALKICPGNEDALVLLAETRMMERRYAAAAEQAQGALKTNPRSIPALSVLAAAQLRQGDMKASEATQAAIIKINPRPAALYYALGKWLAAGRQYPQAESMLKKSVEYAPTWAEPATELGQLYMEMGEEIPARKTLEAAFTLDSFNQHSHNVLLLLNQIDSFARLETPHFIIKFDEKQDGVIAPYFAEVLERVHDGVCGHFSTTPEKKTQIEIFPTHMDFSVRITGRPFIATVGACTGPVIAIQAPRGGAPFGRFNWASTLRHEFTHTVTLAATENRIPHWMTEGMAVYEEPAPRSWRTKQLLSETVRRDRLFTLETIDWGFMRPRRKNDRELAYAQSEWMIEYIIDRFGKSAAGDLLKAFRDGLTQSEAFERVLHVKPEKFSAEFKIFAEKEVKAWGLPDRKIDDPQEIEKQLKDHDDDPVLWARMAEAQFAEGEFEKAEEAARKAIKLAPDNHRAMEVFGGLLIAKMTGEKDEGKRRDLLDEAEPILQRLLNAEPDNPGAILHMGYALQGREKWDEAAALYQKYQSRFPDDPDTYRRLAGMSLVNKQEPKALEMLEKLFTLVDDEPAVARQIGEIYAHRGEWARAGQWYSRAVEIDAYDYEIHALWGEALLRLKDMSKARREFEAACRLKPDEPDGWKGLAEVSETEGDSAKASEYKKKLDELGGK